jgi:hypothetical protein
MEATSGRAALNERPAGSGRAFGSALLRLIAPLRLAVAGVLVCLALGSAGAAQGRMAANPTLEVTFFDNGSITVALPGGTPLGTTTGAPTIIPAGYYALELSGPGGCSELPYLVLTGPGVNVLDDMDLGEMKSTINVRFLPNSTYTWRDDGIPGVAFTFVTSSEVKGSPPAAKPAVTKPTGTHATTSSQNYIGSAIAPFRGTLSGAVTSTGKVTVAFKGKNTVKLQAGKYTVAIRDLSATRGLMLTKNGHKPLRLSGAAFVGKRSVSVRLTAGKWSIGLGTAMPGAHTIVVR